jgi:hypothetical protein
VSSLPSLVQQHVQKHKNNDSEDLISALTAAASARLAAAAAERDNEKGKDKSPKHLKKSYPSVGIRVRVAKDGSIIRPQRTQATTTESGGQMQAPPPRPNADAVLAFQQQQKQKLQASTSTQVAHAVTGGSQQSQTSSQSSSPGSMNMLQEDRSRSSSFSHVQPQQLQTEDVNSQSMDLSSLPFVSSPEEMDIQTNIHDTNSQRQHLRHQSFGSAHMFDTQPQHLYEQSQSSFDPITGTSGTSTEGMLYNQVSSPFPNGSGAVSASSSPFIAASSGHPSTPTFPPHHSSPPLFGPPPTTSTTSPATYYRGPSSFTSYATNSPTLHSSNLSTLQQHENGSGMPLMDMGMDSTMMPPPNLEIPIYDKSQQQQHAMYDPKPSVVDNMSRHHHHHQQQHFQQHPSYDAGSHRHMVPVMPPWSSPPPPQQQQSSMSAQNGQSFWNNGEGFKFYP